MKNHVDVAYRDQIGNWLNARGLTGTAVEVGVDFGGYAREVLAQWKGQKYICVDPWEAQSKEVFKERQWNLEPSYQNCLKLAEEDKRVVLMRMLSVDAAKLIPDDSVDYVFLDGNHAYEAVMADLNAWYPKIKSGGVLAGHDYGEDCDPPHWCEVKPAVDEWMTDHRLTFTYSRCNSWWCLKP